MHHLMPIFFSKKHADTIVGKLFDQYTNIYLKLTCYLQKKHYFCSQIDEEYEPYR